MLPPTNTPLNQHSLFALEDWLNSLGAKRREKDPCLWIWVMPVWSARITLGEDELKVVWEKGSDISECSFPYGLSREDVEIAINEGP